MIARRIFYWGRVQGVGFRATTQGLAAGFAVAGTVRNLDNGEVEVVVEGEAAEIDRFLQAIDGQMGGRFIRGRRIEDEAVRGLMGFEVV